MWATILKGKATSKYIKNYVYKHGLTEEFLPADYIIQNIKAKGGRQSGNFTQNSIVPTLKALVRDGLAESKRDNKWDGSRNREVLLFKKLPEPLVKSNWEDTVDEMVGINTDFEDIYNTLAKKFKFSCSLNNLFFN